MMRMSILALSIAAAMPVAAAAPDADQRAAKVVSQMTLDEKIATVFGYFSSDFKGVARPKDGRDATAGFIPGVPRLGVPNQWQTDAGVGVATRRPPSRASAPRCRQGWRRPPPGTRQRRSRAAP